jgi:hypothetical protein
MSNESLIKAAKEVFKAHPSEDSILATTDGNYFLIGARCLANDHARKVGAEVITIMKNGSLATEEDTSSSEEAFDAYTVKELKAYAESNEITLTKTKKSEIIEEIMFAKKETAGVNEEE